MMKATETGRVEGILLVPGGRGDRPFPPASKQSIWLTNDSNRGKAAESPCANCFQRPHCLLFALSDGAGDQAGLDAPQSVRLGAGQKLSSTPSADQSFFVVRSGMLKAQIGGTGQVLGFHESGDALQVERLLGLVPRSDVLAIENSALCASPLEPLRERVAHVPVARRLVWDASAAALRQFDQTRLALGSLQASQRIVWLLLQMSERRKARKLDPRMLHMPMGREDIASFLGIRFETVSRELAGLQRSRLIERSGPQIRLLDLGALHARITSERGARDVVSKQHAVSAQNPSQGRNDVPNFNPLDPV